MAYNLFLFDADDTLFDFKAAEQQAFASSMGRFFDQHEIKPIFDTYRLESERVWRLVEANLISKEVLKVERFKRTFERHKIKADPAVASGLYLEALSEADNLNHYAAEICQFLSGVGEVGIVTNGIMSVQKRRLSKSLINPFVSFIAVSEECGFTKPDVRFFDYSVRLAKRFSKEATLMIGDRIETDITGAHAYGLDTCFFNPTKDSINTTIVPKFEISHLSQLEEIALQ
jgi:putative hydrolase of the HAD superfamily